MNSLEEEGVITDCEIQTMTDEAPLDINLHDTEIPCNIIMRVRGLGRGVLIFKINFSHFFL